MKYFDKYAEWNYSAFSSTFGKRCLALALIFTYASVVINCIKWAVQ